MKRFVLFIAMLALWNIQGCGGEKPVNKEGNGAPKAQKQAIKGELNAVPKPTGFTAKKGRTLLFTLSNFAKNDEGKYVVPESGELLLLTAADGRWRVERVKDTESNVLHKAMPAGDGDVFTIGGNEAMLKKWHKKGDKWSATTLWHPTFGGKHNRLRDFEMADFNKDGKTDLAIATHDQGVVAVVWNRGDHFEAQELYRKADTFVHEIEIGDLDGDGNLEIYATPSEPNTSSGIGQGGGVLVFEFNREGFDQREVVHYDSRHIKEILVADVDGDGKDELYAALEAEMGADFAIKVPVEVVRFDLVDGHYQPKKVATLNDRFCRVLTAGDVDGDGKNELIASAYAAGLFVIEEADGAYTANLVDKETGGFEHAASVADVDGNGQVELYVADDKSGSFDQYIYQDGSYVKKSIFRRLTPKSAMVWNITVADF